MKPAATLAPGAAELTAAQSRLRTARELVTVALSEFEAALDETQSAPRASKMMVGARLEAAISKLKEAQAALAELDRVAANEPVSAD